MASTGQLLPKGKWKTVKLDQAFIQGSDIQGFGGLKVLKEYDIVKEGGVASVPAQSKTRKKNKKKKESTAPASNSPAKSQDGEKGVAEKKKKKKKPRKKKKPKAENEAEPTPSDEKKEEGKKGDATERKKPKKKKKKKKPNVKKVEAPVPQVKAPVEMTAWEGMNIAKPILKALSELQYSTPTPIQSSAIPSAINNRLDIVGAAETGSGKTLAFGIPLLTHILTDKEAKVDQTEEHDSENEGFDNPPAEDELIETLGVMESEDASDENSDVDDPPDEDELRETLNDDSDADVMEEASDEDVDNPPREDELFETIDGNFIEMGDNLEEAGSGDDEEDYGWEMNETIQYDPARPLYGLVLAPTRELAIQVQQHLKAAAKYTGIQVVPVVGGMAQQKQERILKRRPEIIVATPGRFYEMIKQGHGHLSHLENVRYLVIDEADRMVEKGHFQELTDILKCMNVDEEKRKKRQNYVFSATLTFVHSGPDRLMINQKKLKRLTQEEKVEALGGAIGIKARHKLVDITSSKGTTEKLSEARINCNIDEKDFYLYYFLNQYPGRTLVFANSKDCIRRLVSILTILKCQPHCLHADMAQKQRLKNLDRFRDEKNGLLLATDVAARGLDIPGVEHVIHYQVPRTTENYIHRSGRTARASHEGVSVMIISPKEMRMYRSILNTLNRDGELPMFPVEADILKGVRERVGLAHSIDEMEHTTTKTKKETDWFTKAAKDADLIIDPEELGLSSGEDLREKKMKKQQIYGLKLQLSALLNETLAPKFFSGKYPTKLGKLLVPSLKGDFDGGAVSAVKREGKKYEKELKKTYVVENKAKIASEKRKLKRKMKEDKRKAKKKKKEEQAEKEAEEESFSEESEVESE